VNSEIWNVEEYRGTARLMAHEVQGPVSVILGCISMLRDETLPAEIRKTALDMIEGEARGMGALVQDLMGTLDRGPEERRNEPARSREGRERFDAHELVVEVVCGVRNQAELFGACVEPVRTGEQVPVMVEASPWRVRCILSHLVRNGLNYSLQPARVFVETRNRPEGDQVEIAVHDYGLGIPRADRERIFEPGNRLSDDVPGTGQGLHLSRMLAEQEGGSLRLEWSEPSKGSVFVLSLPRAGARLWRGMEVPAVFRS
jgi:signal transduction histidine kinase